MGKGDKKTRKGKIAMGSFGKSRPHHVKKSESVQPSAEEKATDTSKKPEKAKKPSA